MLRLKVNYCVVLKYTHDDAALLGHQQLSFRFMFETFIVAFMCFRLFRKIDGVWRLSSHLIYLLNLLYTQHVRLNYFR